ncbi:MAG: glycoside hydrolase family 88 protein [Clostridia bacterium]|nr:glycoside hydrolase family 88 protein [Clostridia bacterium]
MTFEDMRLAQAGYTQTLMEKLTRKMPLSLANAKDSDFIPYTVRNNKWVPAGPEGRRSISWWTNGFWPAMMWEMYLITKDEAYKAEAERTEKMLDEALYNIDELHHDVGFMWHISAGANYRLTGNDQSRKRALLAANILAGRFNPLGFIRAWNGDRVGWAIIDTMMNLNILYWASDLTGDPRFRKIAMIHADTAIKYFIRENGSSNHIVIFDPETMAFKDNPAGQGYASGSSWSRGQAWALYGFTLSWIHTGKQEYLDTARKVARYFVSQIQDDWIPRIDFCQPADVTLKDACAGAIAACGLIELARQTEGEEAEFFFNAGVNILKAMDEGAADWSDEYPAILTKCSSAYHNGDHHIAMNYADFFFIEAARKLSGDTFLFW